MLTSEGASPSVLTSGARRAKRSGERYALARAFCTLKALRQEVQTHSRRVDGPSWMRTFCRFGFLRRRVALREWLRALPKSGLFPQE
jgi:hypothetical protein